MIMIDKKEKSRKNCLKRELSSEFMKKNSVTKSFANKKQLNGL